MTGNIGAEQLQRESNFGFQAHTKTELEQLDTIHQDNKKRVMGELRSVMLPELINRIDKVVIFKALTTKEAKKVLELQLGELNDRLVREHTLSIQLTPKAKNYILKEGYEPSSGVRTLRRTIQDELEDQIADGLLRGSYKSHDTLLADVSKGSISVRVKPKAIAQTNSANHARVSGGKKSQSSKKIAKSVSAAR